jgi:hypothetical protein
MDGLGAGMDGRCYNRGRKAEDVRRSGLADVQQEQEWGNQEIAEKMAAYEKSRLHEKPL